MNPNIQRPPAEMSVEWVCEEAEIDEQWSFVGNKSNPRWIWYAVEHSTNTILAYVFGKRKDIVFKELKALLEPFKIKRYYTDDWGLMSATLMPINTRWVRVIPKKSNARTWIKRLTRKTLCFSKSEKMHDIVIGLLINKVEFGVDIHA